MLAPFATLAFLAMLWLAANWLLDLVADAGGKIGAALAGRSMLAQPSRSMGPVSVRCRPRAILVRRPLPAQPEWRVAA